MDDLTRRRFLVLASAAVTPPFLPVITVKADVLVDLEFQRAKWVAGDEVTLEENRARLFATTWGDWEIYYGGYDTAADGVPTWAVWDNPIDDDGLKVLEAGGGFRLNTPKPGILSVDRSFPDPLGRKHGLGSVISRRDEYLRPADGLSLEFRGKIRPPTQPGGFMAYYRNGDGTCYGLHLSQDAVRGGGYGRWEHQGPPKAINTTDRFHTYRLVIPPNSLKWSAYIDGKHAFDAQANSYRVTSLHKDDRHSTIIIGGEKGNKTTSYELDYVAYRRGAFAPGKEKLTPPPKRTPPPLPVNLTPTSKENWKDLQDAMVFHYPKHRPIGLAYPIAWQSARPGYQTVVVPLDPPVRNKGNLTVEWRMRVEPHCEPRGFSGYLRDGMGTVGMLWSPDKVELSLGVKNVGYYKDIPIGIRRFMMDTTDRAHTYRLVRRANTMYAHLYVDDNPIPVLYDQHLDASISGFFDAPPPALLFGDTLNNWGKGRVTIERLRWSNTAFAPPKE